MLALPLITGESEFFSLFSLQNPSPIAPPIRAIKPVIPEKRFVIGTASVKMPEIHVSSKTHNVASVRAKHAIKIIPKFRIQNQKAKYLLYNWYELYLLT